MHNGAIRSSNCLQSKYDYTTIKREGTLYRGLYDLVMVHVYSNDKGIDWKHLSIIQMHSEICVLLQCHSYV